MVTVLQLQDNTVSVVHTSGCSCHLFSLSIALLLTSLVPECMFHISAQNLFLQQGRLSFCIFR